MPRVRREMTRVVALLLGGSAIPAIGRCHWEGIEAADPSTPAAVLRFESAAAHYSEANITMVPWRALFAGDGESGEAAGSRAPEAGANAGSSGAEAQSSGAVARSSGADTQSSGADDTRPASTDARSSGADDARRTPATTAQ